MYGKVRKVLAELVPPGAKILIAISGGPDSVALGHVLRRYAREVGNVSLVISHINHGVRPEAAAEERLVQDLAVRWEIPCLVHRFAAKDYAHAEKLSFQEGARQWRYRRWREDMVEHGCTLLATAHHLGDQAETILYRLLRGSGPGGLAGIKPCQEGIIRPFLTVTKEEIVDYCREHGLPYAIDRSNEEPVYVRNRIRLELLPELARHYNPQIVAALGRTGELLRWDDEYLEAQAAKAWHTHAIAGKVGTVGLRRAVFQEPPAIVSRLLRKAAMLAGGDPRGLSYGYVKKIMDTSRLPTWNQDLPGMRVMLEPDQIWFWATGQPGRERDEEESAGVEALLRFGEWTPVQPYGINVGFFPYPSRESAEVMGRRLVTLQAAKIKELSEPPVCRTRRPGDKLWLRGVGHKTVKKILQEARVPVDRRDSLPLIASGSRVLWLPGLKADDYFLSEGTGEQVCFIIKGP